MAGPDPGDLKNLFGGGGFTASYAQSVWERVSQRKPILFSERAGSVEAALQEAAGRGELRSVDDVVRFIHDFNYARAAPGRAAALNESREALRGLPDDAAHALDPGPAEAPSAAPPGPPDEPARTPYLDPAPDLPPAGPPAAALSAEEFRQLAKLAGGSAAAETLLKALQEQGAVAGGAPANPSVPPAVGGPAPSAAHPSFIPPPEPASAAPPGVTPGVPWWADLPPLEAYEGTPFRLPELAPSPPPPAPPTLGREHLVPQARPAPLATLAQVPEPAGGVYGLETPPVLGLQDLLGAVPVLGAEDLAPAPPLLGPEGLELPGGMPAPEAARVPEAAPAPLAWPVLGAEHLADAAALAREAAGAPQAVPVPQPPLAWPVLGEADVAPDETWYHPFREPGAGAGRGAAFEGGAGGGEGPGIMAVLERIASGIDRLVEIMSQGGQGDSGGATRFRRPDFGDGGPDWDDEDDDPDVPASPSVDRYDLWRPGQDRVETSRPEGRRRPRQPKHHDEPGTGVG